MRPYRKKRELNDWILRKLGKPVIDVVVDATQIDDCIDQACDFFGEFAGGIGNVKSIALICPEQVYYDGTGTPCQNGPVDGKWRKAQTIPPSGYPPSGTPPPTSEPSTACPPCAPGGNTAIVPVVHNFPSTDASGNVCPVDTNPGPGWCGDGIPPDHCFTEKSGPYDPDAIGPFWVEGDTQGKPLWNGYVFKSIYNVPSDVIAVHQRLESGILGMAGNTEENALFAPAGMLMQAGGSWGMQSAGQTMDNRWGFWMGTGGGFVDIVGWQLGMQYIEMFRQLFTVKMEIQLNALDHQVVITPPPNSKGVICCEVTRRVADESMYGHQWVRDYAMALAMVQVGMNGVKYTNLTFPGGSAFNADVYLSRGDAMREKLEAQLTVDHMYSEPVDFFVG
jgi:hypothetical protein